MSLMRTALLLGGLTAIFLAVGWLIGGFQGLTLALVMAFVVNILSYYFSDRLVLSMYGAKPFDNKRINNIVERLSKTAGLPRPKIYLVNTPIANAFATGRNPQNASLAITKGLIDNLNDEEVEAVISHEIAHIKNRDILVATMAAVIAGAISYIAQIGWWSAFGSRENNKGLLLLPLIIIAPLGAMLVQLAISRGREYGADYGGAIISKKPRQLASALEKIARLSANTPLRGNPATSHLWFVNPFKADSLIRLFSTHPPISERIKRLREMNV